jgi:hypothetical protein
LKRQRQTAGCSPAWIGEKSVRYVTLFPALVIAGCYAQPEAQPRTAVEIPEHLCAGARGRLDELSNKAVMVYDDRGEATIERTVWLEMSENARTRLTTALAYHAACAVGEKVIEQEVAIRGNGGMVLTRRLIDLTDLSLDPR